MIGKDLKNAKECVSVCVIVGVYANPGLNVPVHHDFTSSPFPVWLKRLELIPLPF